VLRAFIRLSHRVSGHSSEPLSWRIVLRADNRQFHCAGELVATLRPTLATAWRPVKGLQQCRIPASGRHEITNKRMRQEFQRIAILGRHGDPRVTEPMAILVRHLTERGLEVLAADDLPLDAAVTRVPEAELPRRADLIVAIGGDGTMLYAGRLASDSDVPLLGINRGRLGFLADVKPAEMLARIDSG
jgi:hypothetical protein